MLTIFQIFVVGDSFGECSMPIMIHNPWTIFFFVGCFGTVGMGMLNLALSAIVDGATEVRERDEKLINMAQFHYYEKAKTDIQTCCVEMDTTHDGRISLEQLADAYDGDKTFQDACQTLGISGPELSYVFFMMDDHKIGSVKYEDFASHLLKLKTDTQHSTIVLIKQQLMTIHDKLLEEMGLLKQSLIAMAKGAGEDARALPPLPLDAVTEEAVNVTPMAFVAKSPDVVTEAKDASERYYQQALLATLSLVGDQSSHTPRLPSDTARLQTRREFYSEI
jgi:hypothetical protein